MELTQTLTVAESVLTIEPLGPLHGRAAFVCKEQRLTDYLCGEKALRDSTQRNASVYCCIDENNAVKGYYTLSTGSISRDSVARAMYGLTWKERRSDKHKVFDKFPYDSIGVIILGRIAIDLSLQGTGFGQKLIGHALNAAVNASRRVAAKAVYLDAKNEKVASIYQSLGFESLPDNPLSMFILMETLEQAYAQASVDG